MLVFDLLVVPLLENNPFTRQKELGTLPYSYVPGTLQGTNVYNNIETFNDETKTCSFTKTTPLSKKKKSPIEDDGQSSQVKYGDSRRKTNAVHALQHLKFMHSL